MPATELSVFDFAIRTEEEGAVFYADAAKNLAKGSGKAFLEGLAKEEEKHALTFRKLKEKAARKGIDELLVSADVSDYLDAIVRGGLFETALKSPESPKSMEDVYKIAIRAERNSILLYGELARMSKDKTVRKLLKQMEFEEKTHLVKVVALRADEDTMFAIERFGVCC